MSDQILATKTLVPAASLGGPDPADPTRCSAAAIAALAEAAGPAMRMTSLALDVTSHPLGEGMIDIAAKVDKRAKSIVFVSVEARAGASLVFSAQGLFARDREAV